MRRAILLVFLLAAPAIADHVYSHRFVFEGRLVGEDGTPLPGRVVEFYSQSQDFVEPCREGPQQRVTDEWGDFRFCFHEHELATGARAGARYGNITVERPLDIAFRRSVVQMREPNETGLAPEGWNETYRISGRAWEVGPTEIEEVAVYGVASIGILVNLTVRAADGSEQTFRTTTDAFGDFDLVLETADPENVTLTLEALGHAQPTHLEPFFHRTYAPIYLPGATATKMEPAPFDAVVPQSAPGSSAPRVHPVLWVALALGLGAATLLSQRKKV